MNFSCETVYADGFFMLAPADTAGNLPISCFIKHFPDFLAIALGEGELLAFNPGLYLIS